MKKTIQFKKKLFHFMKLSLIQICIAMIFVGVSLAKDAEAQEILNRKISIRIENQNFVDALTLIENQAEVKFTYRPVLIATSKKVSLNVSDESLSLVLDKILSPLKIKYKVIKNQIVLSRLIAANENIETDYSPQKASIEKAAPSNADITITGKVSDENGEVLPGVSIVVKDTRRGITTNTNGEYSITVPDEKAILVFSYVGFETQEIIVGNRSMVNVNLKTFLGNLEEIVVVGYGEQQKKLITGATSQVKGSEIQKRNTTGMMDALKGQVSGLNISKVSAQPGDGFKVSIRGLGTTGNSNPLFVVDGVPVADISQLNPAEIESLDVLKDAASAAIYGSRASNGVILITTKKGKVGKMTLTYDGFYGMQNIAKKVDYLGAKDYLTLMSEHYTNNNIAVPNFEPLIPAYADIKNGSWNGTNWLDATSNKNAPIQNHSINISGGANQAIYSMGVSVNSEEGIVGKPATPTFDRYSFRINSEFTLIKKNSFDMLKIGENLNFSHTNRHVTISEGAGNETSFASVASGSPVIQIYNPDPSKQGIYPYYPFNVYGSPTGVAPTAPNPLAWLDYEKSGSFSRNNNIYGNMYLIFQPIKKLVFRTSFGINPYTLSERSYVPAYLLSATPAISYFVNTMDRTSQSLRMGLKWIFDNTLSYNFKIQDKNNFDIMVGASAEKSGIGESISGTNGRSLFNDFDFAYLTNNKTIDPSFTLLSGSPLGESKILSTFGRLSYDFKQTYLFTGVLRADGSSNFAPGKRWGLFPSVSAGWAVTNEPFMKNVSKYVDYLKLRASWGENGNQSISPFQYLSTISFTNAPFFRYSDKTKFDIGGFPNILPNPDVSWETSSQTDIGFDARLLKSKIGLTFDWYNKLTQDWLIQAPILATDGTGAPFINGGDVQNRGYEIAASFNDEIGDFSYGLSVNAAFQKNKVTRIANSEGIIHGPNAALHADQKETYRAQVGMPIGYFWGLQTNGLFQNVDEVSNYKNPNGKTIQPAAKPGDLRYVDQNKDGVIDQGDNIYLGDPNPTSIFGFTLNCAYKSFDITAVANGVAGNEVIWSYFNNINHGTYNWATSQLGRWHGEGTSNTIPRINIGSTQDITLSDRFVSDASFLRMSNLTLGYNLKSILKQTNLQNFRLYISGQNLFTITKYQGFNPEVGNGGKNGGNWAGGVDSAPYPLARTYLIGLSIKF
jgi:TonB-dependent starch-binding outer membrane protein SusC